MSASDRLKQIWRQKLTTLRCSVGAGAHRGIGVVVWRLALRSALLWRQRNTQRWYICRTFCRSLVGHIQEQRATGCTLVDLGTAYLEGPDGRLQPNIEAYARTLGIQSLNANFPWASPVDLRVFLLGFDEGARLSRDTSLASKWAETYKTSSTEETAFLPASKRGQSTPPASRESAC
jgi:hypothetical protein